MLCVGVKVGNGAISYRPRISNPEISHRPRISQEKRVKSSHFYVRSSIWKFLVFYLVLGKCRVLGLLYGNFSNFFFIPNLGAWDQRAGKGSRA